jgi:hypothetical protein
VYQQQLQEVHFLIQVVLEVDLKMDQLKQQGEQLLLVEQVELEQLLHQQQVHL